MELHRTPLLRFIIPFVIGILFNYYIGLSFQTIVLGLLSCSLILSILVYIKSKAQTLLSISIWTGVVVNSLLFFLGSFSQFNSNALNNHQHVVYKSDYQKLLVRVISPPLEKEKTHRLTVNVESISKRDTSQIATGKILLYISKSNFDSSIKYGDYLLIKNQLQKPPAALGKDSFNYAKWLSQKNIYYTSFLKSGDYIKTNKNKANSIFIFSYNIRTYFDNILSKYLEDSSSYSIASAITLGIRNHIDDNLNQAFARTGTIHILAVSGLHVGIIYLPLMLLLGRIPKRKWTSFFKISIILSVLWLYALITGLSPSVVRASTMFSFLAIGEVIGRKTNVFNSLAAAALFTLTIDANTIFQVGFQLSYLAVAGIGLFYTQLVQLLSFKTLLISKIWKLLCVSFSAQVATAPLALYYFHQFPNYFLFSNLLIVPLGIISVYLGIFLLLTSPLTFIAIWVAKLLEIILQCIIYLAKTIGSFPLAYTSGIYFSVWNVITIYAAIIFIYLFLKINKAAYLIYFLAALILFFLSY